MRFVLEFHNNAKMQRLAPFQSKISWDAYSIRANAGEVHFGLSMYDMFQLRYFHLVRKLPANNRLKNWRIYSFSDVNRTFWWWTDCFLVKKKQLNTTFFGKFQILRYCTAGLKNCHWRLDFTLTGKKNSWINVQHLNSCSSHLVIILLLHSFIHKLL